MSNSFEREPRYDSRVHNDDGVYFANWLAAGVAYHSGFERIMTYPVTLSGKEAKILLSRNVLNRLTSYDLVATILSDMRNRCYVEGIDPIAVDRQGVVISGQHRSIALVVHDEPLPFQFAFNMPRDHVSIAVDHGMPRGPKALLQERHINAEPRYFRSFYFCPLSTPRKTGPQEIAELLGIIGVKLQELTNGLATLHKPIFITKRASLVAAMLRASYYMPLSKIIRFAGILNTGPSVTVTRDEDRNALVLRDTIRGMSLRRPVAAQEAYVRTCKALEAYQAGRAMQVSRIPSKREQWPDTFPLPAAVQQLFLKWDDGLTEARQDARGTVKEARQRLAEGGR